MFRIDKRPRKARMRSTLPGLEASPKEGVRHQDCSPSRELQGVRGFMGLRLGFGASGLAFRVLGLGLGV